MNDSRDNQAASQEAPSERETQIAELRGIVRDLETNRHDAAQFERLRSENPNIPRRVLGNAEQGTDYLLTVARNQLDAWRACVALEAVRESLRFGPMSDRSLYRWLNENMPPESEPEPAKGIPNDAVVGWENIAKALHSTSKTLRNHEKKGLLKAHRITVGGQTRVYCTQNEIERYRATVG